MRKRWLSLGALVSVIAALVASCGKGSGELDPEDLGIGGPDSNFSGGAAGSEKNFAALINNFAQAKPAHQPWAGFWWPYTSNGIARSTHEGASPAGRYDAARGRTTNAQNWEVHKHGSAVPKVQGWWGHCNGWCVAAALFPEPRAAIKVNGIRFGIGDIKALLTEAGMEASADFFGERVDPWDRNYQRKFEDTIPNQFMLVLTNYMGIHRKTVLIDRFTGGEVWNQPLAGYRFEYPKPSDYLGVDPQAPNVHRLNVTATIWWMEDNVPPEIQTPPFDFKESRTVTARTLKMEVWLDGPVVFGADGKITQSGNLIVARRGDYLVGGAWKNGHINHGHPDYMWVPYSILKVDPVAEVQYANAHIDIDWIKKHVLSGGVDDPSVTPAPIEPAPAPSPRPSPGQPPATPAHPPGPPVPGNGGVGG